MNPNAAGAVAPMMPTPGQGAPWMNPSKYMARTFFTYEADIPTTLGPGATQTLTFNIAGDSDFFWTKFTQFSLIGGAQPTTSAYTAASLLIVNTTTGRQYSSTPVPLLNFAGDGRQPFILPQVTLWEKKSTIQLQLLNLTTGTTYSNLYLSFLGIKAFLA